MPIWKAAFDLAVDQMRPLLTLAQEMQPRMWQRIQTQHPWLAHVFATSQDVSLGVALWSTPVVTHLAGLGPCTEWPLAALALLRQHLRLMGIGHQVIGQSGHFKTGFKLRTLTAVCLPSASAATAVNTPFSHSV